MQLVVKQRYNKNIQIWVNFSVIGEIYICTKFFRYYLWLLPYQDVHHTTLTRFRIMMMEELNPVVALLPIADKSQCGLNWSLGDELYDEIYDELLDRGDLFFLPDQVVVDGVNKSKGTDYFGRNLNFTDNFGKAEFLVIMEFIEHDIEPYERGKYSQLYPQRASVCPGVLKLRVRIRVIDVRCDEPQIVLQEIVQSNHMIPLDKHSFDYNKCAWGKEEYCRSFFYSTHRRLACDLAERIEKVTHNWR